MSLRALMSSQSDDKLYVEDVFSAYVRPGTGADVVVTTGIDMTKGYMLWTKGRSGATDHAIYDSARGVTKDLVTNSTAAETTQSTGLKSVSTTGHTIGSLAKMNTSSTTYVDWVMRKAPKFFDVVTYTGNGIAGRQIAHSLGCEVGLVMVKRLDTTGSWTCHHRTLANDMVIRLESTGAQSAANSFMVKPTDTYFTVNNLSEVNASGGTYVAYLFAHDTSADGIIQCGSFTETGSLVNVNLGFEPQYLMVKRSNGTGNWWIFDTMRGLVDTTGGYSQFLYPNSLQTEVGVTDWLSPTATGFKANIYDGASATWVYMAIRRPMKVPTSGTEVYNAIAYSGDGTNNRKLTGIGFASDLVISGRRTAPNWLFADRLRGASMFIRPVDTSAEVVKNTLNSFDMNGVTVSQDGSYDLNYSGAPYINHFFKRAKGFMDEVCYTGTGIARTVNHNLGVVPELMIVKDRGYAVNWQVYHKALGNTRRLSLNTVTSYASPSSTFWNSTDPTDTSFTVGTYPDINASLHPFVWYGFATLIGVSKVGSYIGNGTTQTVSCGFSSGARFVIIKRYSITNTEEPASDWYIWDTARGIVAGNDPHLSLNTTSAEVTTDDSIDPESSGFIVNQVSATNINVTSASYIFLAIA